MNADDAEILKLTQGDLLGHNQFAYFENNPVNNVDPNRYGTISIIMKKDFLRDLLTAGASATAAVHGLELLPW